MAKEKRYKIYGGNGIDDLVRLCSPDGYKTNKEAKFEGNKFRKYYKMIMIM